MKKFFMIQIAIIVFALLFANAAFALAYYYPESYEGGVKGDSEYQEMLFITGEPVLLKGTVRVSLGRLRDGKRQDRITYSLFSDDKSVNLSRSITLSVTMEGQKEKSQIKTTCEVIRASETVSVKKENGASERYTLKSYSLTASTITDISAAVDYSATIIRGSKVYEVNNGQGTVTVEISGKGVGYDSAWGATESRQIQLLISSRRKADLKKGTEAFSWKGSVEEELSLSRTRDISYVENQPTRISFKGAYAEIKKEESIASYSYDLPRFDENGMPEDKRNRGSKVISLSLTPKSEMAYIPKVADLAGHWARSDAEKLLALGIIRQEGSYFWPKIPAKRLEFALAMGRLTDAAARAERWAELFENTSTRKSRKTVQSSLPFDDLVLSEEDAAYVLALSEMGVMEGTTPRRFSPNENLTRAQVVTIMVRALGLEKNIPRMYRLGFKDEGEIPPWAKDAVYVGSSIGLVRGDEAGYFRPDDPVTRAEAAAFLNRFMTYLKDDLRRDFRDRLMEF
ncbi:MAG: hypothetical protein PWP45_553 [Tepidanaerobacteraceae bacterium]|nr:hypothetical protein [Tepidanaerobacteraceae bacterium]